MPTRRYSVSPQGSGVGSPTLTDTTPLPAATQGVAYNYSFTGSGGYGAPFVYLLNSGTLPAGLFWNTSGQISGTPTATGSVSISVSALDFFGNGSTPRNFSLTVNSGVSQAATPTFSPVAGTYTGTQSVAISCSTPSSTIFYTTNGTTPTTGSAVYSGPLTVSANETIKAIATATGFTQSNVGSAGYIINPVVQVTNAFKWNPGRVVSSEMDESTPPFSQVQNEINTWAANPGGFLGYRYTLDWSDLEDFTQVKNLNNPAAIATQYPGVLLHQAAFYYLMAKSAGTGQYQLFLNFERVSPNSYTNAVITGTNWLTTGLKSVPAWVIGCTGISGTATPGTLTIPDHYGASTTTLYSGSVAPLYSGSAYYGFSFCAYNGTSAFSVLLPKFWEPPTNQARKQAVQALAMWQFTAGSAWSSATAYTIGTPVTNGGQNWLCVANNTNSAPTGSNPNWIANIWVGQPLNSCPNVERWGTNDEYSYTLISGTGSNISGSAYQNPPFSNGISAIAPTSANAFIGLTALTEAWQTATPNTVVDTSLSSGFNGIPPFESNSTMPGYWNNLISGTGLSAIQGVALGNSNWFAQIYSAAANSATANPFQQGHLGISPALGPAAFTLPAPSFTSLVPLNPVTVQHQPEDYWEGLPAGVTGSTAAAVTALLAPSVKLNATHEVWNITTSQAGSPFQFSPTFYTSVIQPTLASTPIQSTALVQTLMYAPNEPIATAQSATSVLVTWSTLPLTGLGGTGAGMSLQLYRDNVAIPGAIGSAQSFASFTDTVVAGASHTYAVQMSNANGTGPLSNAYPYTAPVFDFPNFTSTSGLTFFGSFTNQSPSLGMATNAHQAGACWYTTQQNVNAWTTSFTIQSANVSGTWGFTFCLQNSNANTNNSGFLGLSCSADANGCGYGGFQTNVTPPVGNSIGIKVDISGNGIQEVPIGGVPNNTGLYINGGYHTSQIPAQDLAPLGINFQQGHTFVFKLVYDGTILTMVINDTTANVQTRLSWPINVAACIGQSTAWPGFTSGGVNYAGVPLLQNWVFTEGFSPRLATPTFSVTPGQYTGAQSVSLSGPSGATLYYTTNGLPPTSSSTLYTGTPVSIGANTYLQAVAIQPGFTDSYVAQGNYQIQAATTPLINFPSGFASTNGLIQLCGGSILSGSSIEMMTVANVVWASAAWYAAPVNVQLFTTSFSLQFTGQEGSQGGGIVFALQNQPPSSMNNNTYTTGTAPNFPTGMCGVTGGPFAFGNGGTALGYGGINGTTSQGGATLAEVVGLNTSVGIKFDYGNNATGIYTDGANCTTPQTTLTGLTLSNGHVFNVVLTYNGTTLTVSVTDATTLVNFTTSFTVNIPSVVGANTAYVGFTAGTQFNYANSFVSKWTYTVT